MLARSGWFVVAAILTVIGGACSAPVSPATQAQPRSRARYSSAVATFEHGTLDLYLAQTPSHSGPLVLYSSGDGGWFGAAVDMFKQLASTGCPVVGFSARAFLRLDRRSKRLVDTQQLGTDYATVITQARAALTLPQTTPVVLTGWSRGAAFAVLAASQLPITDHVVGVIAIGLTEGEDLSIDGPEDETDDEGTLTRKGGWPFQPYTQLGRLTSVRAAVIQASRDGYLAASRARELFGADTDDRRFYAVEAKNHRFSGGKPAFDRSLHEAVSFVTAGASSKSSDLETPCP